MPATTTDDTATTPDCDAIVRVVQLYIDASNDGDIDKPSVIGAMNATHQAMRQADVRLANRGCVSPAAPGC